MPLGLSIAFSTRRSHTLLAAAALAVAGLAIVSVALLTQHHAPRPPASAATAALGPTGSGTPTQSITIGRATSPSTNNRSRSATRRPGGPRQSLPPAGNLTPLSTSTPVTLRVPAIGVTSNLLDLGISQDGSVQVPPLSKVGQAGWYQYSATPGSAGSAVVLGHVDSATYGQGVFFDLGALRPGDEVDVTRADGTTAVFRIDRVAEYPKTNFPTKMVYGSTSYASINS